MDKEDKELEIKKLEAELGNLQVQNAEYQQIVKTLSEKLRSYESKYGAVFIKST